MAEAELMKSCDRINPCWFCCTIVVSFAYSIPSFIASMILFTVASAREVIDEDGSGFRAGAIVLLTSFFIAIVIGTIFSILQCIRTCKLNRGVVHTSSHMIFIVQPGNNNAQEVVKGLPAYNTTVEGQPQQIQMQQPPQYQPNNPQQQQHQPQQQQQQQPPPQYHPNCPHQQPHQQQQQQSQQQQQQPTSPLYTEPGSVTSNQNCPYTGLYTDTSLPTPNAAAPREQEGYLEPIPSAPDAGDEGYVYPDAQRNSDNYLALHDDDGNEIGTYDYIP